MQVHSGDQRVDPTDDELMLMPAILHGFSLGDRKWRMFRVEVYYLSELMFFVVLFNVTLVEDIFWNPEAFEHLDISRDKKDIVRTLTLSHARNAGVFDDFIEGKGVGLIFNLHGELPVRRVVYLFDVDSLSQVLRVWARP